MSPRQTGRTGQPPPSPRRAPRPATRRRALPKWARRRRPETTRPPRDWIQISVTALPGLAAVIALIFTSLSIRATGAQLQITEQGQITDRYNAAITNLGSPSVDVRLGGIYALQRIMEDSSRDQPTVVAVLCAFVRDHANTATGQSPHPPATPQKAPAPRQLATDIQAALTVVGTRNAANDGSTTVVDFIDANLTSATLSGLDLGRADLFGANLTDADLTGADLGRADLFSANLSGADLGRADLSGADLTDALLSSAYLAGANLTGALLFGALLTDADLSGADLTGALLGGADLSGANLTGTKGLRTGTRRSPIGSTPAPSATKNLRR